MSCSWFQLGFKEIPIPWLCKVGPMVSTLNHVHMMEEVLIALFVSFGFPKLTKPRPSRRCNPPREKPVSRVQGFGLGLGPFHQMQKPFIPNIRPTSHILIQVQSSNMSQAHSPMVLPRMGWQNCLGNGVGRHGRFNLGEDLGMELGFSGRFKLSAPQKAKCILRSWEKESF